MAKKDGTVRVSGLPQDISESRLIDKLYIHFLRRRNGGGEISSVTVSKTKPWFTLITFEDSEVARRVVEHQNHILSVNAKEYKLNVSLHSKERDPDELFVDTAVTVDYNILPGGKTSISNILKNFCNVKCTFHIQDELCTFKGRYSEVKSLTKCLLRLLEIQTSKDVHSPKAEATQGENVYNSTEGQTKRQQITETPVMDANGLNMPDGFSRAFEKNDALEALCAEKRNILKSSSSDERDEAKASHKSYDNFIQEAAALEEVISMDDFSIVIDSDIFQYLKRYCSAEYQSILNRHEIEVLDVTTRDITTLFLQLRTGAPGRAIDCLRLAYGELGWLFQDKESQLRKEQLAKESIPIQWFQQAFEDLTQRFTKLLIGQDKSNVFLVGSGRDVSEAKQFLLKLKGETEEHSQESFPFSENTFLPFRSETKYRKGRAMEGKDFKMAAKFGKDLGSETSEHDYILSSSSCLEGFEDHQMNSLLSRQQINIDEQKLGSGPISVIMGQNVDILSSGPSGLQALNPTEEDSLFKRYKSLYPASLSSELPSNLAQDIETKPTKAFYFNESHSYSLDHIDLSVDRTDATGSINQSKSISTHIFSEDSSSDIDLFGKTKEYKPRTLKVDSHFETKDVLSVDLVVPTDQWLYIQDVFHIMLKDITSDLQMKVKQNQKDVVLHLRGKDLAKVHVCQQVLKELISSVGEDFFTHELSLTQLGATDFKNETVEVLCTAMREKCSKVKILPVPKKESLLILGPKLDCMEAMSLLKNMFHFGEEKEPTIEDGSTDLTKTFCASPSSPDIYPSSANHSSSPCEKQYQETEMAINLSSTGSLAGVSNPDITKSPTLKLQSGTVGPVDKNCFEKIGAPYEAEESLRIKKGKEKSAMSLPEYSAQILTEPQSEKHQIPTTTRLPAQNKHTEANYSARQSNDKQFVKSTEKASLSCVCETTEELMSTTVFGGALSNSQVFHQSKGHNIGIQGTMAYSEMSISLSGYNKDTTLKITYNIPDGMQGKDHPNPGRPFQGGTFHAFLPLNQTTRKLLPSLRRAFHQGQTFTVRVGDNMDQVTWANIPHKTSIDGGISRNGYPDSRYLKCLAETLRCNRIEG